MARRELYIVAIVSVVSGMVGGALATWGLPSRIGQSIRVENVEAEQFVLVDKADNLLASLSKSDNGPELALFDGASRARVLLTVNNSEPGLVIRDEIGQARASLLLQEDEPWLMLADDEGRVRAALFTGWMGSGLALFDKNGKSYWNTP